MANYQYMMSAEDVAKELNCSQSHAYGRMRCEYLKNHRRGEYIKLLMDGRLNEHLHEIDTQCYERVELLVE